MYGLWNQGLRNVGGVQLILRTKFTKTGYLKYLSHLDLVRLFTRTFSKAGIPIRFSEGFNPHPKFSIGNPLPLGTESLSEYMDVELAQPIDPEEFAARMNRNLPEGIRVVDCYETERSSSLTSIISWSHYEIRFMTNKALDVDTLQENLEKWTMGPEILITKKKKKGKKKIEKQVNIVPLIGNVVFKGKDQDGLGVFHALLSTGEAGNLKPIELMEALERELELGIDLEMVLIKRLEVYRDEDGEIKALG